MKGEKNLHFSSSLAGKDLADFYEYIPIIIRECIGRLNDENKDVLKANQRTLAALSEHVPAEELVDHIEYIRNLIATLVSDARRRKGGVGDGELLLPGFNMPKGKLQARFCHLSVLDVRKISLLSRPSLEQLGCKRLVFLIHWAFRHACIRCSKKSLLICCIFLCLFRSGAAPPNIPARDIVWCAICA